MSKTVKNIYKVIFLNQGKIYELYARTIQQGDLYGFVEAEELIFGEQASMVVNPSEERVQSEFAGVKRTLIPIHSVIRIDEVEKEGVSKIRSTDGSTGNIATFPGPAYPPGGKLKE
jgi:hypothetical protein